jgi:succinate dehydrogenase / fumarate reductase, membrane anchor subunit
MVNKLSVSMSLTGSGLKDWLVQRFSSLSIALYFFVLLGFFCLHPNLDHASLRHFFSTTWMQVFSLTALLSLFLHAWVGIWTVITDYINLFTIRLIIQVLVIYTLIVYFFWGVEILWKIA